MSTVQTKISKVTVDPVRDERWKQLLNRYESDVFHSPAWLSVLEKSYGFKTEALVLMNEKGEAYAGFAYCLIEDIFAKRIVSLPFSDFLDPLVDSKESWEILLDELLAEDLTTRFRVLHSDIALQDSRLEQVGRAKWHCTDTTRSEEEMWAGLEGSAKRAIKKARRENIQVTALQEKAELIKFFNLHLGVRKRKYDLLAQPYSFFEAIWDEFMAQGKGQILIASTDTQVIGSIVLLEWADKMYYKLSATDSAYLNLRPNDLLIWEGLKEAHAKGMRYFDFGISDWEQEGLIRYKRKFATQEKTVSFLTKPSSQAVSAEEKTIRKLFSSMTELFVDDGVSDEVSARAGNLLYRYFI